MARLPTTPITLLSALLLLFYTASIVEAVPFFKRKHKRQKAGTKYGEHDAVHVVVNKVG
jgi:hypothetical protein